MQHDLKNLLIDMQKVKEQANRLQEHISILHSENHDIRALIEDNMIRIPHRCPICSGKTYDINEGTLCLPCDGRGIVWG